MTEIFGVRFKDGGKQYYFEDKNYEQIAQEEGCSFQMVAKSVKAAIRNLKKILR